jgi:cobalamin biosynthesis protein CobD/CbiB
MSFSWVHLAGGSVLPYHDRGWHCSGWYGLITIWYRYVATRRWEDDIVLPQGPLCKILVTSVTFLSCWLSLSRHIYKFLMAWLSITWNVHVKPVLVWSSLHTHIPWMGGQ